MGRHGPIPKRTDQLRRNNPKDVDNAPARGVEYVPPRADERWHPVAQRFYEACCKSGQVVFYEKSDWALLWTLCESLSRDLKPKVVGITEDGVKIRAVQPIRGSSLNAYMRVMTDLLVTEGARRRARIELVRGDSGSADDGRSGAILSLQERLRA